MSRILIAGAGALGSAIAVVLAQAGLEVVVVDPAAGGDNASGVAAGMLAPAFEAVLDPVSAGHFELMRAARDLWPDFAQRLGGRDIGLRQTGALWVSAEGISARKQMGLQAAFSALDVAFEVRSEGLFTPEDWRLEPLLALAAMRDAAEAAGVTYVQGAVAGFENGRVALADGRSLAAAKVVLATGANDADLAPELHHLTPILGQILHYSCTDQSHDAPISRWHGGYRVATSGASLIGATMEPGRRADPAAAEALHQAAAARFADLAAIAPTVRVGVRAATPDGLPLVGPSSRPNVFLAAGARRNGWLLAPLVAGTTAAYLAGDDAGPYAAAMDARRFNET